ncbi:probable glycerol-3-phosphate acyltransferase 3 [Mangifera indica]|uniref:probable glycerol-3-phosphate acyltransferase 3 n=1 Tax=Mangifera indica TaxID=29780 RepID=UPI001CFA435B|nr:probable glycerol-3-phosphate acyltransferase 3 [Mangifera indica]
MSLKLPFLETLFLFLYRILFKQFRHSNVLHRTVSNNYSKFQRFNSLAHRSDLSNQTLIFNVEGALLKSSSLFPYFMLVAFEAGGLFRAFVLLISYPFIRLAGEERGLKIMVMICFFGIKKDKFRVGKAVLPKFFLENVGFEIFEVVKRGGKKVGVSNIPRVMIESFLRDYLEIDVVVGRELKVFCGYFVGLMEERKKDKLVLREILGQENNGDVIGIIRFNKSLDEHKLFLLCKEIYMVKRTDKRCWQQLPRDKYHKPLIFHDGRLAFRPTVLATVAMFMWVPFGFLLAIFRAFIALTLPFNISIPTLSFSGLSLSVNQPNRSHALPNASSKHLLYVCNHRTLLDPLYLSFTLKKNFTAVTYSLSRMSEILAPIRTVRLTRNRDQDAKMMQSLLKQGDLVVCPEGTTCREPYLLRFSPLFSEMSDTIVPVACNSHITMFYGTTAGGLKCLDPLFFLLNPSPSYTVQLLNCVSGLPQCVNGEKSRFDVANHVQSELANALGFEPTKLTRRDKYQILAGNDGIACTSKKP